MILRRFNDTLKVTFIYGDQVLVDIAIDEKNNQRDGCCRAIWRRVHDYICQYKCLLLAANIVERIRKAIMDYPFVEGIQVTISAGVKQYEGDKEITAFIDEADKNLYEAKTSGKKCGHC